MQPKRYGRRLNTLSLSAALIAFVAPPSAGAATQLGQLPPGDPNVICSGGFNSVQSSIAAGTPYEVPSGGGVITGWQHRGRMATPGAGRLQVWSRAFGTSFTLVGRSDLEAFTAGVVNSFPTRIPVGGGELLGLRLTADSSGCGFSTGPGDLYRFAYTAFDPAPGDLLNLSFDSGNRLNVAATLEPDCDGDGFGDETQDPSLFGGSCPPQGRTLTLDTNKSKVKKGKRVLFSGQLNTSADEPGCEGGQTVDLQRKRPKQTSFATFDLVRTDAQSTFSTKEKVKKTFEYRAVAVESAACGVGVSDTEKVKVRKKVKKKA